MLRWKASLKPTSGGGGGGGGGGVVSQDGDFTTATAAYMRLGYDSNRLWSAGRFVAGSAYTLVEATVKMLKSGSPTFGITASIYDDNSGEPDSLVGTASNEIDSSTISTSEETVTFTGFSASLTSGNTYHIVFNISSGSSSYYNNYAQIAYSTGLSTDLCHRSPDGSTWTRVQSGGYTEIRLKTYSASGGGGGSYTLKETFADDSAADYGWSKAASSTYVGTLVAPASSYTATRLEFHLKKTGTGGDTITAQIWSATGSAGSETPNALLATSTTTVAVAGVSATKGFVAFDFAGQALASGTKYFFVMKTPTTGDNSNYYNLTVGSSYNTTNFETVKADATPTWSVANGGRGGYCRSYSGGGGSSFPSTNLVAFYKLEESSGDALDSSGNSRTFTETGTVAATTGTIGGETVNVRTLDRPAGEYFSRTDDADFDVGDGESFTISFWAKASSSMGNYNSGGIFSKRNAVGASDAGYTIALRKVNSNTYVRYNAVCDGTTTVGDSNTSTGVATDAWAHYIMVFTADATIITYVNNAQYSSVDASSVTGSLDNSKDNYIGQLAYNNNGDIIADVTHLGFWKKALDATERTALYNSGKVLAPAAPTVITLETSATTSATSYATPANIDVNIPAVSANDILLLFCTTTNRSTPTDSPPSGWTKIREQDSDSVYGATVAAYWKRASGSASATTETWSAFYPWGETYYIWVGAYSGCVTSGSPVNVSAGDGEGYSSQLQTTFTTAVDNAMVVSIAGVYAKTSSWSPDGEIVDVAYSGTEYASISGSIESTAGSKTVTDNLSGNTRAALLTVALRDTAPAALQTRTVTFTSKSQFTIDSDSGQTIWTNQKLDQAEVGTGLRLWNGSEAGNSGASESSGKWEFSSGGNSTTWWENYYMRAKQDPGTGTYSDWINLTNASGDIYTSCQPAYNNIGSVVSGYSGPGSWTTHASGFKYQVEIYSASNRP